MQLLLRARQTRSYKKCLKADAAIDEDCLQVMSLDTGAVVPGNMVHERSLQFGMDTIDCSKESTIGISLGLGVNVPDTDH